MSEDKVESKYIGTIRCQRGPNDQLFVQMTDLINFFEGCRVPKYKDSAEWASGCLIGLYLKLCEGVTEVNENVVETNSDNVRH